MGQRNKERGCIPEGTSGFLKPVLLPIESLKVEGLRDSNLAPTSNSNNLASSANEGNLAPLQMTTM